MAKKKQLNLLLLKKLGHLKKTHTHTLSVASTDYTHF